VGVNQPGTAALARFDAFLDPFGTMLIAGMIVNDE
jgi:hypothetical protein